MTRDRSELDLGPDETRDAVRIVGDAIVRWLDGLRDLAPAGTATDPATCGVRADWTPPLAHEPLPETGTPLEPLVDLVTRTLGPDAGVVGHPGYMAYVAGAGNVVSALGQALAMTMNPYTGTAATAPALVRLEDQVIRWFARIVGYPDDAGGFLTTGSSLAILSAVIAARERAAAPWDRARCYVPEQTHHAVGKALFAAGFRPENVVVTPSADLRADVAALAARVSSDRAEGFVPVLVVGTAGTTNAGRVDPLDAIADVAARHGAWFHCDGAYGGFFRLLDDLPALRGMERADSVSLDPHKSLQIPYGTGALLVRRPADLRFPRGLASAYMPPIRDEDLRIEYAEMSPELSRDFRGLRVWLALKHFGIAPFRANLREKRRLALRLADRIAATPSLELVAAPDLTIVAFRVRGDDDGARTRSLLGRINGSGRWFLTGTTLAGAFAIRACLLGFRCDEPTVDDLAAFLAQDR